MSGASAGRRRTVLAAAASAVALAPVVAGIALTSGGAGAAATPAVSFRPVPPVRAKQAAAEVPGGRGALIALVRRSTTMRSSPAGRPLARLSTKTEFGSPEALWVVRRVHGWLGVVSPLAGNGKVGWIPQSAGLLGRVPWELKVSLSARRLTVLDNGAVLARYTVAIGRPDAPTPTGRFAVTDRLFTGDPQGPYGCCILALSAHSPHAIQGWTGGNRIAIHSTPDTASIGEPVSHGCLRLTLAQGRWLMNHIPLGTPTLIGN